MHARAERREQRLGSGWRLLGTMFILIVIVAVVTVVVVVVVVAVAVAVVAGVDLCEQCTLGVPAALAVAQKGSGNRVQSSLLS